MVNIPSAFLHTDKNKTVSVRFTKLMVNQLLEIYPNKYASYMIVKDEKQAIHVKILYVLHDCFGMLGIAINTIVKLGD
jgi:hypothetical protein